jgi:thiol-disulfide isomerase/thioredoxin
LANATRQAQRKSPALYRALAIVLLTASASPVDGFASEPSDADAIPHVNAKARENFLAYRKAANHKAFAIAPGGAWGWEAELPSPEAADSRALYNCQVTTRQKCVLYAADDAIVFDAETWPALWGPYQGSAEAATAPTGASVGERFFDIAYKDASGTDRSLAGSRGKIVFVHFWGSWCPPCLRELPALQKLQQQLQATIPDQVVMILLQVREPFDEAKSWATDNGFASLPLYDSGSTGSDDTGLALGDGERIEDRNIARVFPSSYVLDRNGIVLFSNFGPVEDWLEYLPFLEHAARHSETMPTETGTQP